MAFPSLRVRDGARRATFAAFATAFILAAAWQAFGRGQAVNGDGISYLDLAVQYSRGDFSAVRNGYWSPLYPALIGLLFRLGATPATELVVVYGMNVVLAAVAMLAFAWMLRELEWQRSHPIARAPLRPELRAGAWALFAWYMFRMLGVHTITPDGLVGIYLFVSVALLARQISGRAMPRDPLWLGLMIGTGYLAKAVLLPVGIVLGATYTALSWRSRHRAATVRRILLPAAVLAVPLLAIQSLAQGRFSFGETGRINYAWFVAAEPLSAEDHATRSSPRPGLAMRLDVAEGALVWPDSNAGTYAFWYDPSRWTPQWHPRLDVARQLAVLRLNARWLRLLAWIPAIVVIALLALGLSHRARVRGDLLPLAVAPGALLCLYLAVHAEARLAGAAIIVLLVLALALPQYEAPFHTAMLRAVLVGWMAWFVVWDTMPKLRRAHVDPRAITDTRLADALTRMGLGGTEVALIGDPDGHYWAHAARLRIVAELPAGRVYTNDDLAGAIRQARSAGRDIRAVLVRGAGISGPTIALPDGWHAWLPPPLQGSAGRSHRSSSTAVIHSRSSLALRARNVMPRVPNFAALDDCGAFAYTSMRVTMSTSTNPAATTVFRSSASSRAPAIQPFQRLMSRLPFSPTAFCTRMSPICNRPPGLSTRAISRRPANLSGKRFRTPFEMTTSAQPSGTGSDSAKP